MSGNREDQEMSRFERSSNRIFLLILGIASAFLIVNLAGCGDSSKQKHQAMIHDMGSHVMPFEIDKTLHIFEMTVNGGIQQVVLRNTKDEDQLFLIRQHLQDEAERFSEGDFSDPQTIHGNDMPGIKELEAAASKIRVIYVDLPDGAQIIYETSDIQLITAIHSWFGAQLSDHGADATYR
jgi:hypothetical protein